MDSKGFRMAQVAVSAIHGRVTMRYESPKLGLYCDFSWTEAKATNEIVVGSGSAAVGHMPSQRNPTGTAVTMLLRSPFENPSILESLIKDANGLKNEIAL